MTEDLPRNLSPGDVLRRPAAVRHTVAVVEGRQVGLDDIGVAVAARTAAVVAHMVVADDYTTADSGTAGILGRCRRSKIAKSLLGSERHSLAAGSFGYSLDHNFGFHTGSAGRIARHIGSLAADHHRGIATSPRRLVYMVLVFGNF